MRITYLDYKMAIDDFDKSGESALSSSSMYFRYSRLLWFVKHPLQTLYFEWIMNIYGDRELLEEHKSENTNVL